MQPCDAGHSVTLRPQFLRIPFYSEGTPIPTYPVLRKGPQFLRTEGTPIPMYPLLFGREPYDPNLYVPPFIWNKFLRPLVTEFLQVGCQLQKANAELCGKLKQSGRSVAILSVCNQWFFYLHLQTDNQLVAAVQVALETARVPSNGK